MGSWGMRTMGRCSRPKPASRNDNVVVIDEEDDVLIIDDAAEKSHTASQSKNKKGNSFCSSNVIDIDDEEDGAPDMAGPSTAPGAGSPEASTPLRGSPRNRYGLNYDSYESEPSEGWSSSSDDSSDCEILDDTSARKLWENAASRKKEPHNPQGCEDGKGTTSASSTESSAKEDANDDIWVFPCSSADCKDDSPPIFVNTPEKIHETIPEGTSSQKYSPYDYNEITKENKGTRICSCMKQTGESCAHIQANSCSNKNHSASAISGDCPLPQNDFTNDPEKIGLSAMVQDALKFKDGLIGEREKHKESVEYKRAAEEEWASRQRQLQIQAEEAKKLRKRKKAEALRLLDMEKRQKQRLEEVRESQRKNEEAIQLKEQYRGVVRSELETMERKYSDMASILRSLGIPVEGVEVKAAYKQALLKFHPDRVSRSDIYQQVKAEETFKFISRLKEKLHHVFK